MVKSYLRDEEEKVRPSVCQRLTQKKDPEKKGGLEKERRCILKISSIVWCLSWISIVAIRRNSEKMGRPRFLLLKGS